MMLSMASHSCRQRLSKYLERQTTAYFGALVFGSDIDGRQMRGKGWRFEPFLSSE